MKTVIMNFIIPIVIAILVIMIGVRAYLFIELSKKKDELIEKQKELIEKDEEIINQQASIIKDQDRIIESRFQKEQDRNRMEQMKISYLVVYLTEMALGNKTVFLNSHSITENDIKDITEALKDNLNTKGEVVILNIIRLEG